MNFLKNNVCSILENRDGHLVGLIEAKPEVLGTIYPFRKDVTLYVLQFCIHANFLSVHLFFDGHIAGLMEAKPEELGKICSNRKDVPLYVLQFCIHTNFLSVQLLRRYEFFKK